MKRNRRSMVVLGAAATAVLLAASPAFACLTQKGDLTLTPSGGSSYTVTGDDRADMRWCGWPSSAPSIAKGGSVRVQVAASECEGDPSQLPTGTYTIRLNSNTASPQWKLIGSPGTWQFQSNTGCFRNPAPEYTIDLDKSYSVTSGSGDESVTIPNDSTVNVSDTGEAAGLCVGTTSGTSGIFGPLRIT